MDALPRRRRELLALVCSELRSTPGAFFDALDMRAAAFTAAVDALRPLVPAPLSEQYTKWFDRIQEIYVCFCKFSKRFLKSIESRLNDVSPDLLPEDSDDIRNLESNLSDLAVYDLFLRCIDPENFEEVRAQFRTVILPKLSRIHDTRFVCSFPVVS